jgi:hypothetical protein
MGGGGHAPVNLMSAFVIADGKLLLPFWALLPMLRA